MSLKEDVISHTFHSVPVCSYTFPQSTVSRNVMSFCFCISSAGENMFQAPPTCAAATVTPSHCSYNTFKRQRQTTPTHTHRDTDSGEESESSVWCHQVSLQVLRPSHPSLPQLSFSSWRSAESAVCTIFCVNEGDSTRGLRHVRGRTEVRGRTRTVQVNVNPK